MAKPILSSLSKCCKPKIGILGIPFNRGQKKLGVENAPKVLRDFGIITRLKETLGEVDIKDYGDTIYQLDKSIIEPQGIINNFAEVGSCAKTVSKQVESIINDGRLCINIGGDHSVSIGTVDGHVKASGNNIALLWIDAHSDINTHKTSNTGNVHGMPVSLFSKELAQHWPYLPGMDWLCRDFSLQNLAYIGLRSVDIHERTFIEQFGITAFTMEHIDKVGINKIVQMALDKIDPFQNRRIHVSYDIDSLDMFEAPSTGTPVRGGMTLREGLQIMEVVQQTGRVQCVDMVEINPSIGSEKDVIHTVDAAIHLLSAICGYSRTGKKLNNNTANTAATSEEKLLIERKKI